MARLRILLAEDERTISRLIRQVLTGMGHEVAAVEAAHEAIALLATGDYDLILLDLNLSDGDGMRVVDELERSSRHRPPVVVMTGEQPALEGDPRARAVTGILPKPFEIAELEALIARFSN